jgi:glycosyltransferase involved in cell wall biosynthesis
VKVRYTPDVFRFQRAGGVSRYFVELARGLQQRGVDARIVAGLHINDLVADAPRSVGANVGPLGPARARQAVTKVADQLVTGAVVGMLGRGDIVHPTWYPPALERLPRRARLVTTVFDMIPERFPELSVRSADATRRKRAWVEASDHVLVISEHTRRDLVELFGVDPERVTVTPLGITAAAPVPPPGAPALERSRFVLYVGDRVTPYKNFSRLLDAMAADTVDPELRLVCVGPTARSDAEQQALVARGLEGRVEFLSGSDGTVAWLYSRAVALVYPSIYEGFGLPPLEAMANGCPVIASDAASIPEVVGDAAVLVDPNDSGAFAAAIAGLDADAEQRERLVARGRERAEAFTWASTVDLTLQVYEGVVRSPR